MPSQPRAISRSNPWLVSRSIPSRRWPYGPAHEQPPRDWIPNRSLSSATTKLWCRYLPRLRTTKDTIDSRSASWVPRISIAGFASQRVRARSMKCSSRSRIASMPDGRLQLEHEARADRLDDGGRAALLAVLDVREVDVLDRVDVLDGAAAGHRRDRFVNSSRRATRSPGVPGPPMNLWGEMKTASLYASGSPGRVHLDRDVRRGGREVAERQRAVLVQQRARSRSVSRRCRSRSTPPRRTRS